MSKGVLAKVMKYELRYLDGCGDFSDMQEQLWALQRQTREILNRSIQIAFHWDYANSEHHRTTGEYLDLKTETGYKRLDGHIYNCLKGQYKDMATGNLNVSIQKAWKNTITRVSVVYQSKDKVARFRDTVNHRYGKAVIDYALKNQCGTIQKVYSRIHASWKTYHNRTFPKKQSESSAFTGDSLGT